MISRLSLIVFASIGVTGWHANADPDSPDPVAPPFVCVLDGPVEDGADVWEALRARLTDQNGDPDLAVYETRAGIRYASPPQPPVVEPAPDLLGAEHRRFVTAPLNRLRAIPDYARPTIAGHGWVNITAARDELSDVLGWVRDTLANVARIDPLPEVVLSQPAREGGATMAIRFTSSAPLGAELLQLDADGRVTWTYQPYANDHIGDGLVALPDIARGPEWIGRACLPPVYALLLESGRGVALDELDGRTFAEVVALACEGTGETVPLTEDLAAQRVASRGGEVRWSDVLEALVLSSWAQPFWDGETEARVWGAGADAPSERLSRALEKEARNTRVPEMSAEADALVGDPLKAWPDLLGRLPVPPELFVSRWRGRLSELPAAERASLEAVLERIGGRWIETLEDVDAAAEPVKRGRTWLHTGEDPIVEFRMVYRLVIVECVEYSETNPVNGVRVPCPVPDSVYDELGASRDLPVYYGVSAVADLY